MAEVHPELRRLRGPALRRAVALAGRGHRRPMRAALIALALAQGGALAEEAGEPAAEGSCPAGETYDGKAYSEHLLLQLNKPDVAKNQPYVLVSDEACHTAVPGELCHTHVSWAMKSGYPQNPAVYPGLRADSSFEDFQAWIHRNPDLSFMGCPVPCAPPASPAPSPQVPTTPRPTTTPARIPAVPRSLWAEQSGARIPVGGQIRFYIIGTSNVAWQTWPDQLHVLLRGLGYTVPKSAYKVANLVQPTRAPICDNAADFASLETPRVAKVGWSSWGFAYDSKADCKPDYNGFRQILTHQVSCMNSWACVNDGQTESTLVRPSEVAADAKNSDVVIISNWINDSRQKYAGFACIHGENLDDLTTVDLTIDSLRRLVAAIRGANSKALILVLALYPDAAGREANGGSMPHIDMINKEVSSRLANERNTIFVNYTFPVGYEVFQFKNYGHANCRGDKVMATRVLEAMYSSKVLARGLAVPSWGGTDNCLGKSNCADLSLPCCQRSALCQVTASGTCTPYGPGIQ